MLWNAQVIGGAQEGERPRAEKGQRAPRWLACGEEVTFEIEYSA